MSQIYLSVIIPSYNEQQNLKRGVLEEVLKYLQQQKYVWELVLTDDGSTDGTLEELRRFAQKDSRIKVVANLHKGKGPTVTSGMLAATGQWRLFADFDQSTPLSEVEKLLEHTNQFEVIVGSRECPGAVRDKEPFYRHLMGRGFNWLVQLLAVPKVMDTQCGFKLFSQEATKLLFNQLYIYAGDKERSDAFTGAFDVELLFLARKAGFKIKEAPIVWQHFHTDRVSPIKDSWRMLQDIIKIRLASCQGKY